MTAPLQDTARLLAQCEFCEAPDATNELPSGAWVCDDCYAQLADDIFERMKDREDA